MSLRVDVHKGMAMIVITLPGIEKLSKDDCIDIFLASHCGLVRGCHTSLEKLFNSYAHWSAVNLMPVASARVFSRRLSRKGFRTVKKDEKTFKLHIRLSRKCQDVQWRFI